VLVVMYCNCYMSTIAVQNETWRMFQALT